MPIPNFQSIMLPILKIAGNQDEHRRRIVVEDLVSHFSLTYEEWEAVTQKTEKNLFASRCDFALSFLRKHRLIKKTRYGYFIILERGLAVLKAWNQSPKEIEDVFSKPPAQIIAYLDDKCPIESEEDNGQSSGESIEDENEDNQSSGESIEDEDDNSQITVRSIEENYQQITKDLAAELLEKIKENSPTFFEELVIDLLVEMGYGGSRADAEAVGRSGDGGIDGVINEDRLGLDVIYVQAKRWDKGNVGEPDIARFAGALAARGANKGIFITTSDFTKDAKGYDAAGFKIILINGSQLAQYMIEHNVGVSVEKTYEIKRVDSDYFVEDAE